MMELPFLIRGTNAWDNREYLRYLDGNQVMSFGPLTPELEDGRYIHVRRRIREHLGRRGVPSEEVEKFINHRPK
jgi:hypothetical protein